MKKHFLIFLINLFIVSDNLFAQSNYAPTYLSPAKIITSKSYKIEAFGSYFSKTSAFDANGESVDMNEGEDVTLMDGHLSLGYSFGLNFYLEGFVSVRHVTSTDSQNDLSASGLESFGLLSRFVIKRSSEWNITFEARASQSTYSNDEYPAGNAPSDDLILGDSGTTIWMGGNLGYNLTRYHYFTATMAYVIPPSQLSQYLFYDIHMALAYTRFGLRGGLKGMISLSTDEFSDDPSRRPSYSTGQVASFNSLNKEELRPYVEGTYSFKKFSIGLYADSVYAGKSTDEGVTYGLRLTYFSDGLSATDVKINSFKEYIVEASVIKVSPRGKFVKIDKGLSDDIQTGMRIDFYKSDFLGGNILVATGQVYESDGSTAIVKILKKYKDMSIEKGFYARGY